MTFYTLYEVFAVCCVFYPSGCSQFGLAMLQVLRSPLWLGTVRCRPPPWVLRCRLWTRTVGVGSGSSEWRVSLFFLKPLWEAACAGWFRGSNDLQGGQDKVLTLASFLTCLLGIGSVVPRARGWLVGAKSLSSPALTGLYHVVLLPSGASFTQEVVATRGSWV